MPNINLDNLNDRIKVSTINDVGFGEFGVHMFVISDDGQTATVFMDKQAVLRLIDRLGNAADKIGVGAIDGNHEF